MLKIKYNNVKLATIVSLCNVHFLLLLQIVIKLTYFLYLIRGILKNRYKRQLPHQQALFSITRVVAGRTRQFDVNDV